MNAYEKVMNELGKIKSMFENATEETVEITFETATLLDGETTIEFETLEAGQQVFIVTPEGRIPAPEGTHALGGDYTGVTITVDADGFISEVTDERGTTPAEEAPADQTPTDQQMSAEAIEGIINGKLSTLTTTFEAVVESLKSISDDNASLRNEIASLKADFESFKAMPSNETKENEKFSRAGNLTAKQQFLKQYKNL
jgi:regulator of replication initiation timing